MICARIAHLVRTGRSEPARIAALTFTRKAANDMAQRLRTMLPSCSVRTVASFVVGDPDQAIYGPRPNTVHLTTSMTTLASTVWVGACRGRRG